ncbi:hypothetical protein Tsubulata_009206 [Turnera subulata]|uniref:Phytocyanin domain-containing protein n=1 Tax=Turnera subulata TaxID=218843 RepID=A0A9Q0FLG3_9ROSI|nr:hypothetical protein Tsubulata_009206 [Turnera subulata]
MGSLTYAQGLVLLLSASLWAVSVANRQWRYGFNYSDWGHNYKPRPCNSTNDAPASTPKKIIVGGSQQWTFGVDYADWAIKNGPFYLNDTLVFKYDPPSENNTHPHSVYLLPNMWSFKKCDLTNAVEIANVTQGGGDGFEFVLEKWQPYYFACGGGNGFHCNNGTMKFSVMPSFRRWHF